MAAHEHAVDRTAAVSVATAEASDGWLGATARVSLATAASPQLVMRLPSLAWLAADA